MKIFIIRETETQKKFLAEFREAVENEQGDLGRAAYEYRSAVEEIASEMGLHGLPLPTSLYLEAGFHDIHSTKWNCGISYEEFMELLPPENREEVKTDIKLAASLFDNWVALREEVWTDGSRYLILDTINSTDAAEENSTTGSWNNWRQASDLYIN
jgi:hypothetical protein